MTEETKQILIVSIAVVAGLAVVACGIVSLNKLSNDYWQPLAQSCVERGGSFTWNTCYGAKP